MRLKKTIIYIKCQFYFVTHAMFQRRYMAKSDVCGNESVKGERDEK